MSNLLKKLLVPFIFLFSVPFAVGQISLSGEIEWEKSRKYEDGKEFPHYSNPSYKVSNFRLPYFAVRKQVAVENQVFTGSFININYIEAPANEIAAISEIDLKEVPEIEVVIGKYFRKKVLTASFYPYVKQNGIVKKVRSFTIRVTPRKGAPVPGLAKKRSTVANSVLNSQGWYKIAVTETGLFKLTPGFLSANGISSSAININDLRVTGNGVGMLPELVGATRPDDLQDVPLKIFDQNGDGFFNGSDFAVFYAKGPHQWSYNSNKQRYDHQVNVYRSKNYYFLSVKNGLGARVNTAPAVVDPVTDQVSAFDDYAFVEDEEVNLVGTGREWFGQVFDIDVDAGYSFNFPNLDKTEPVYLRVRVAGRASTDKNTAMISSVGGQQVLSNLVSKYNSGVYADYATINDTEGTFNYSGQSDNLNITLRYEKSANPAAIAWLDFLQVQVRRSLVFTSSAPLYFRDMRSVDSGNIAEFTISGAISAMQVWDVTDPNGAAEVTGNLSNGNFTFRNTASVLHEYVAFQPSSVSKTPEFIGSVATQNLHGLAGADMLIVSHSNFLSAAERLANFHREKEGLEIHVVTTEEVYNEFSSGGQDITAIRDFAKNIFEKSPQDSANGLRFLLLMGDASYDYKDRIANNSNFVPIYEGGSSLGLYNSLITDDYYGYMDDNEGSSFTNHFMDIGVGRIPATSLAQANAYVDKVIHYVNNSKRFGDWRNKILLMADDVDEGWESTFVASSEEFTGIINQADKSFNVEKIYLDSYRQVSTTGSQTYPEASDDMFRKVQQGNLISNYIGHGGEIGLSSEKFIQLSHINDWTNKDAMPLFLTITCEFTRLDDPKRVSAGEQLGLNPNGGAIALISTTRVVYAQPAIDLNEAVFSTCFEKTDHKAKFFGDIIKDAKNEIIGDATKTKFSLIGDPAVRLAIPYYNVQTNTINGKEVATAALDTLKALSKVKVTGQVNDFSNQKIGGFNGVVNVSVYDKPVQKKTLVNDGIGNPINFNVRNSLIYRGKAQVTNGGFQFEFLVPKDISYQFGSGKLSYYATDGAYDAAGYMDTVTVGGFNDDFEADETGPVVELYLNDESFVRGGVTDESPELYAIIADSSGINTVGTGIGHDMVAILDEKTDNSYVINEYYEADLNSYQRGTVRYPFFNLEEGQHTLRLKVFDVHNNFSEAETDFIVAESAELALKHVLNYPNPFTTYTEFQFEHNRIDQPLEVQVQIFTVSGKLVKTINKLVVSEGYRVTGIAWNGLDDYGDKIGKGVYVYRLKVRSQFDNSQADQYEKLVILR